MKLTRSQLERLAREMRGAADALDQMAGTLTADGSLRYPNSSVTAQLAVLLDVAPNEAL